MKKNFRSIFVAALAVVAFASCSKDNNEGGKIPAGKDAKLNITIDAPEMSRATGSPATGDANVTGFTVWIFNNNGGLEAKETAASGTTITGIDVTTNATEAYVVANCDDATVAAINTKDALLAYLGVLDGNASQAAKRWATGADTNLTFTADGSGNYSGSSTIALKFIAARITVKIVPTGKMLTDYDAANTDGDLVLEKVAVLNGGHNSKLFGTSLVPSTMKWIAGIADNSFANWPASNVTVNGGLLSNAIAADDFTTTYHYYVFENAAITAATFPTIVTLVGEFDGDPIYFPVHLAPYEKFKSGTLTNGVERGKSYDITITLSGDPANGGGGGTDPTVPTVDAKYDISISITDWIPVPLEKEFN